MEGYRIGVCCTFGAGSSMMLKMNLDTIFRKMQIKAEVVVYDIAGISSMKNELDAIYTSSALVSQVQDEMLGSSTVVVPVINYFDLGELERLTKQYLTKE